MSCPAGLLYMPGLPLGVIMKKSPTILPIISIVSFIEKYTLM